MPKYFKANTYKATGHKAASSIVTNPAVPTSKLAKLNTSVITGANHVDKYRQATTYIALPSTVLITFPLKKGTIIAIANAKNAKSTKR